VKINPATENSLSNSVHVGRLLCRIAISWSVCHKSVFYQKKERGIGTFLASPTLRFKEIQVPTNIRVLPSGTSNIKTHRASETVHAARRQQPPSLVHAISNFILFRTFTSNVRNDLESQNTLARTVLPNLRSTPVASLLLRLHWLPVISRIKYKLATIT